MDPLPQFWLPVLAAAVSVFVASALIHMVLRWHRRDYLALAGEESIREAIRAGAPQPGLYPLPYCGDMKDMNDPAVQARYREGPVALITVMPTTLSAVLAAHASAGATSPATCWMRWSMVPPPAPPSAGSGRAAERPVRTQPSRAASTAGSRAVASDMLASTSSRVISAWSPQPAAQLATTAMHA